jgi:hypothetical protein
MYQSLIKEAPEKALSKTATLAHKQALIAKELKITFESAGKSAAKKSATAGWKLALRAIAKGVLLDVIAEITTSHGVSFDTEIQDSPQNIFRYFLEASPGDNGGETVACDNIHNAMKRGRGFERVNDKLVELHKKLDNFDRDLITLKINTSDELYDKFIKQLVDQK